MAKHTNWYLDGWEYQTIEQSGCQKTILTYKGAYYSFKLSPKGLTHLKLGYLLLALATCLVFLLLASSGAPGGETFYSGIPCMLSIIPFIYLGMGVFCLLTAKDNMTYRSYYASVKRISYAARVAAALMGLCVLGEVLYIAVHAAHSGLDVYVELYRLLGAVFCTAAMCAMLYLQKRFPVSIVNAVAAAPASPDK